MYYSYVEIDYVATSFSPARMDLAVKLLMLYHLGKFLKKEKFQNNDHTKTPKFNIE